IEEHERSADHAGALRHALRGRHAEILTALAKTCIEVGTTALPDAQARAVISAAGKKLQAAGQLQQAPEPDDAIDALVDHHLLVRAPDGAIAFQHQQFEEWYGAYEVDSVIAQSAIGDEAARKRLRIDILNAPAWEEAILFACERGSRAVEAQAAAVA